MERDYFFRRFLRALSNIEQIRGERGVVTNGYLNNFWLALCLRPQFVR